MPALSTTIELNDRVSSVLDGMLRSANSVLNAFSTLSSADVAPAIFTQAREQIAQTQEDLNRLLNTAQRTQTPIHISVDDIDTEIFNTQGLQRFQQELQDTNRLVDILQNNVSNTNLNMFDDSTRNEYMQIQQRISSIQARIRQIQANPRLLNTSAANSELERLRGQLSQCINAQNNLNRAMQSGNANAAVSSFNTLRNSVRGVETNIRQNINAQNQFTNAVRNSETESRNLKDVIGKITAAYATIKGGGKILDVSDDWTTMQARLNLIKDDGQTLEELTNLIHASSQESRSDMMANADAIYGFATSAKDAFTGGTKEVVKFSNLLSKSLKVAGADATTTNSVLLQLKQGLGSGKLQGDEFRSLSENAPQVLQYIADSLGKTRTEVKEMSSEGKITADVVKNAIMSNAEDIEKQFKEMPRTFSEIWIQIKNDALMKFAPVLDQLNDIANNPDVQKGINYLISGFGGIAQLALFAFENISKIFNFIGDNWEVIKPILIGLVGAKGLLSGIMLMQKAQMTQSVLTGLAEVGAISSTNAVLVSNIALWGAKLALVVAGIAIVVAVIYGVVAIVNKVTGSSIDAMGIIVGSLYWLKTNFENGFKFIANLGQGLWGSLKAIGSNIVAGVKNLKNNVLIIGNSIFAGLSQKVLEFINLINKIPGINIDTSGLQSDIAEFESKVNYYKNTKEKYKNVGDAFISSFGNFELNDPRSAFDEGYANGTKWKEKLKNYGKGTDYKELLKELDGITKSSAATASNTDATKKALTKTDVKYLGDMFRDFADKNRTNVYVQNQNTFNQANDYDGIKKQFGSELKKTLTKALS